METEYCTSHAVTKWVQSFTVCFLKKWVNGLMMRAHLSVQQKNHLTRHKINHQYTTCQLKQFLKFKGSFLWILINSSSQ